MLNVHQRAVLAYMDEMKAGALHVCAPKPAWVFRHTVRDDAEYAAAVFSHLTSDGVNPTARKFLMGFLSYERDRKGCLENEATAPDYYGG